MRGAVRRCLTGHGSCRLLFASGESRTVWVVCGAGARKRASVLSSRRAPFVANGLRIVESLWHQRAADATEHPGQAVRQILFGLLREAIAGRDGLHQ